MHTDRHDRGRASRRLIAVLAGAGAVVTMTAGAVAASGDDAGTPAATPTTEPAGTAGATETTATSGATAESGATTADTGSTMAPSGTGDTGMTTGSSAAAPAEPTAIELTLTETAIEGLPTDLVAGVVNVSVDDQTEGAGGDVNFTRVEPGTDVATFSSDLVALFGGGPFQDYFLNNAGIIDSGVTVLEAGEYIVWIDLASNLDRESTAEDIVTATLTVDEGTSGAALPESDSTIRSGDYLFAVDAVAGGQTLTFENTSAEQFHHVVIVDFGTNAPEVIEENLLTMLSTEGDAAPPAGIDPSQINFEFAGTGVFGPGGKVVVDGVTFEEGSTYAAICFISDREGGAPHAIAHNMYEVFHAEAG